MGNANCIADGDTPHRSDITICNQTEIVLHLDQRKSCQRECDHKGFVVTNGKIVEGCEPPNVISANSIGNFSVSGREATAVAPGGKVFYRNENVNLEICITWTCSGWSHNLLSVAAADKDHLSAVVTGKPEKKKTLFGSKEHSPWHELISVIPNSNSMEVIIKPKALLDDFKGMLEQAKDLKAL
jgi:hypothetical protein